MATPHPIDSDSLAVALQASGLEWPRPEVLPVVEQYCRALWKENERLNLTRHLDFPTFVARDLNDVVQVSKLLRPNEEVLDIGSGGGVPGIVLAILRPDLQITLCESVGKKAEALRRLIEPLPNSVRLYHGRAEDLLELERFDAAIARAIGPLAKICRWFHEHLLAMGCLLALKGSRWPQELAEAKLLPEFKKFQWKLAMEYPMLGTESKAYISKLWAKGAPER